jgi:hypothetical protein
MITAIAIGYQSLEWSGAATTSVQVRRTGTTSATFSAPNHGLEVINLNRKGSATYTYQVCEVGTSKCPAEGGGGLQPGKGTTLWVVPATE